MWVGALHQLLWVGRCGLVAMCKLLWVSCCGSVAMGRLLCESEVAVRRYWFDGNWGSFAVDRLLFGVGRWVGWSLEFCCCKLIAVGQSSPCQSMAIGLKKTNPK